MSKMLGRVFLLLLLLLFGIWLGMGFTLAWQQTTPGAVPPQQTPALPSGVPANVRAFVRLALPFARQAHHALGWQTSVIVAQWGLEHGWAVPDAQGYNWGNTTYAPGCTQRGGFCYAPTPAEGLREYVYTARLPWYRAVTQAAQQGAAAMAVALGRSPWDAGHYTHDGHPGDDLLAIVQAFHLDVLD